MGAWGLGFFESDHDLDLVSDLSHEAGLDELESKAKAGATMETKQATTSGQPEKAKGPATAEEDGGDEDDAKDRIHYSLCADYCSDVKAVRKHLDGGILAELMTKYAEKMSGPGRHDEFYDPGYTFVLLGACGMTLGCTISPAHKVKMKQVLRSVGLMRDARASMDKALNGPDEYQDGTEYDFGSRVLVETMMSGGPKEEDRMYPPRPGAGFQMLNVPSPNSLPPLTDEQIRNIRDSVAEGKFGNDKCGGCGAAASKGGDGQLLSCGKCKKRKYCSKECQKAHWSKHKKVCKAP